jgi:hypothetical protein
MHTKDYHWDRTIMMILKDVTDIKSSEKILLMTCHGKVMIEMIHAYQDMYMHM